MVWVVLFCVTRLDFLKSHFKGSKYTIQKRSFARKSQMRWYERGNSGGSWLPEEKKANMGHGRGDSGGSWPLAFLRSTTVCSQNINKQIVNIADETLTYYSFLSRYHFTKSKNYLKRRYRIRHWIPIFIGTPCILWLVRTRTLSTKRYYFFDQFTANYCKTIQKLSWGWEGFKETVSVICKWFYFKP